MDSVDMVGASAHDSVAILHLHTNHTSLGIDGQVLLDGTVADLHIVGVLQGRCPGVEVDERVAGEALSTPGKLGKRLFEVGREGGSLPDLNIELGSGAYLGASSVGPLHKVVTGGRRGGEGHSAQVVSSGTAADTTLGLVGAHSTDGVLVVVEVGGDSAVALHLDSGAGSGGNSVVDVAAVPVREVVAILVGGIHRHSAEVVHSGTIGDGTHHSVGAGNGEGVLVVVEHSSVLYLALRHRKGVSGGVDGVARLVHPSHEVVAVVRRSGDGDIVVGVMRTGAGHSTHDVVVVQRHLEVTGIDEVGGKGLGGSGGVGNALGGHGGGAIVPTSEAAALLNRGGEVQHSAVLHILEDITVGNSGVVVVVIGDGTTLGIVADGDVVHVDGEGGNQGPGRVGVHGDLIRGGAVAPAHKVVALLGSGGQGHRSHILGSGAGRSHSTHRLAAGGDRGGDGELILGKDSRQSTGGVGLYINGGIGAVHRVGFLPADEHITVLGCGGEGHRCQVVHRGAATDATPVVVAADTTDGEPVVVEVGGVGLALGQGDSTRVVLVVVVPTGEVVTVVGRGTDLVVQEVLGLGHTAADATHHSVGRDNVQFIHVGVEGGGVGLVLGQGDSARVVVVAILPLHEVVTHLGSSTDLVVLEVLGGGIAATDATPALTFGGNVDGQRIGIDGKVGVDRGVALGREGEESIGAKRVADRIGPVHKVVTVMSGGLVVATEEVLDGDRTAHTTHHVVHDDIHVVHVGVKVGDEGIVGVGHNIHGGIGAHHSAVPRPVHKVEAHLGSGGEGHSLQVVHLIRALDATHGRIVALGGDGVLVVVEVGNDHSVAHRGDSEGVLGALLNRQHVVECIGPVHEVVAVVGSGHIVGTGEVLDELRTGHFTHRGIAVHIVVGFEDCNAVLIGVEVGGEGAVAVGVHNDGVLNGGLNGLDGHAIHHAGPVHKVVAQLGSGSEHHRQVELHGSRAVGRAALRIVSHSGDGEEGAVEVGHKVAVGIKLELVGRVGGNHGVALGPVHEIVAILRCGSEADSSVVVDVGKGGGSAGDTTHGSGRIFSSHRHTGGNRVLRSLSHHEVVHIGGGAILVFSTQDDVAIARGIDGQFVGVPTGCGLRGNHAFRNSVLTRNEGQFCGTFDFTVLAEEHPNTFVLLECVVMTAIHIQHKLVLVGGEVHLRQTQFGQRTVALVGQLQLVCAVAGIGGGIYFEDIGAGSRDVLVHPAVVAEVTGGAIIEVFAPGELGEGSALSDEAQRLAPTAVVVLAAAHHHVVPVGGVG